MHLRNVERREVCGALARAREVQGDASVCDVLLGDLPHRFAGQRAVPQARAANHRRAFDHADALLVVVRTHRRREAWLELSAKVALLSSLMCAPAGPAPTTHTSNDALLLLLLLLFENDLLTNANRPITAKTAVGMNHPVLAAMLRESGQKQHARNSKLLVA
jgi:hypothetical protein